MNFDLSFSRSALNKKLFFHPGAKCRLTDVTGIGTVIGIGETETAIETGIEIETETDETATEIGTGTAIAIEGVTIEGFFEISIILNF